MTDIITLDGVSVDAETGEILDDIPGDRMGWIAAQLARIKGEIKGWTLAETLLRQEAERLLIAAGVQSISTPYGRVGLRLGRETVDPDAATALVERQWDEDPLTQLLFYRTCASTLNARAVKDFLAPHVPPEELERVIRTGRDYIQLDPPRHSAPVIRSQQQ